MKRLFIYLLIFMVIFITGCGQDKTKISATFDEFESIATAEGFVVNNNINQYSNASYIEEAMIATYDDIEIEMIRYSDSDYSTQVQEQQIENFNMLKSTSAYVEKEKGGNYYTYALISNGRYMISTRIDDTLVFSKVMLEKREIVESIIDNLGY